MPSGSEWRVSSATWRHQTRNGRQAKGCDARARRTGRPVMLALETSQRCPRTVRSVDIPGCVESPVSDRLSLWWAPLDVSSSALQRFVACLSREERQRADRIRRSLDRERFLAGRGWLRHLLASQLGCAPADVPIVTGDNGKPSLACSDLSFSASRTAGVALYATSRRMEVGVDIEAIRRPIDIDGIAARFMSPVEQRALSSLSPGQRLKAFFHCWTRKEAYVKGIGTGLRFALRDVDVWYGGRQPATVGGWTVHQVDVAPRFAAAVAGAHLNNWVPHSPRRLGTASQDDSYRRAPGSTAAALAVSAR
jgi:4'-phosphopantetheinyl transferase